ncbi:phosphate ABC transporter permease PstA [Pasteurella bettyae]|uniref:Phosphate transport system permease protein PstA n=1 Tax=Pasteurella bettyae CCUG 2042 TaxID=1095749 RepID=I3D809_9PAST|nr:phosphate ABC transporter permease PstA [Pasteurella bettyae]EIJ67852.1 phosphate ABC transporter, permease protein PstA [Pasteurella bettyae CCUG 2042]SUB22146.1 phosphate transport system permease protein PstA [Pasteurella bettyae]
MQNYMTTRFKQRKCMNKLMMSIAILAVVFGLFWLCWIIATLMIKGIPNLSLALFMEKTPGPGEQGGLMNAILGSIEILVVAVLIGAPTGILAGTYLAEYGKFSKLASITRFLNDILLSAPSIVIGLFIYAIYVSQVNHFSGWAGALALAIIVIPIVVRTTENMLLLIPNQLREAAIALGCPRWKVITLICYKAVKSGILTGVLLAIARIAGETAPLLFTALSNQFTSFNMNEPLANLPVVIYQYAASPFNDWNALAWAGATLITLFVLSLNIFTRFYFNKKGK